MAVEFSPELLERYGVNAPRYTSYPTALQFHERIGVADYTAAIRRRNAADDPVSIYVHIPFCRTPCYYCACNRVITRHTDTALQYLKRVHREIALQAKCFEAGRAALQLHFGGGTPTYLSPALLAEVVEAIGNHFPLTQSAARDYSIEIDPRTLQETTLAQLKQIGFNRLSMGVQDFDPDVQRLINRLQPISMVEAALAQARRLDYSSVNFDLIYGLPAQTLNGFETTLDRIVTMRPDRIAMYGYAHLPTMFKAQRRFPAASLPDARARIALLRLGIERLLAAGYVHIGMDHFALPEDSLAKARLDGTLHRSFQGYTTHADMDLVSFGASAIGRVGDLYVQNAKALHDYKLALDCERLPLARGLQLSRDDLIRADVIQQIMCQRRVAVEPLEGKWGIRFEDYFAGELTDLRALEGDGLLTLDARLVEVTPRGEYLLRNIACVFDAYARNGVQLRRASKAI